MSHVRAHAKVKGGELELLNLAQPPCFHKLEKLRLQLFVSRHTDLLSCTGHGGQSCGGSKEHMGMALPKKLAMK